MKYFSSPENGARATKGWFRVIAPEEDNDNLFTNYGEDYSFSATDADEENERWYYADGDGELAVGEIRKIKGKYYGFRPEGGRTAAMLTGLVLMRTDGDTIAEVLDDDVDAHDLEQIIDDNMYTSDGRDILVPADATLFYFGNDEDNNGAMKTGNVTVNLDGDSHNFKFSTYGGAEGRGLTGIDDNRIVMYANAKTLTADSFESEGDTNFDRLNNGLNTWKEWKDTDPDNDGSFIAASLVDSFITMNDYEGWDNEYPEWDIRTLGEE